jgi:UDP-N-acetylglucosamine:LPS N-acetylglucosamine transferase
MPLPAANLPFNRLFGVAVSWGFLSATKAAKAIGKGGVPVVNFGLAKLNREWDTFITIITAS